MSRISIHAPRTGSDRLSIAVVVPAPLFQSTLPARGATYSRDNHHCLGLDFNPRSPHGERRYSFLAARRHSSISIHAPRTGSDCETRTRRKSRLYFNPRSPHGERHCTSWGCYLQRNFNPRSPHGERRMTPLKAALVQGISIHAPRTGSDAKYSVRIG